MSDLAIQAHRLTKRYGDVAAVDGFDLAVTVGTVVSLLGPNGAGKTTIVRMLATLAQPTSGTAAGSAEDAAHDGGHRVGVAAQQHRGRHRLSGAG